MIAEEAADQGVVHGHLVAGAVEFHERQVREVLTPRVRVEALPADADLQQALRLVRQSGHSRFPVYRDVLDDVLGFVYARDVYNAAIDGGPFDVAGLTRECLIVPTTKAATALLTEMRKDGTPMAIAIDEHGSLAGVLTIEDLVEVIVGEIQDEHGPTVDRITRLPDGVIEADGSIPLHELNEDYELALPESSDYVTLAGLVLSRLGSLPQPGEAVTVPPYVLTVLAIDERRVSRVRIARLDGEEGDPDRVNRADGEEGRDGGTVE